MGWLKFAASVALYLVAIADAIDPESRWKSHHMLHSDDRGHPHVLGRTNAAELSMSRLGNSRRALHEDHQHEDEQHHQGNSAVSGTTATHPDLGLDHLFVPLNKTCHPDCTKRGNCNAEEGQCECPFGYTGPTCEEPLLPACQLGPGEEPFFGFLVPRSCECARQASRFFGCSPDADTCTLHSFFWRGLHCYEFTDKPASEQWSHMPNLTTPGVTYFGGNVARQKALPPLPAHQGVVGRDMWNSPSLSLPLERCGETQCHHRGACLVRLQSDDEGEVREAAANGQAHCMCYKGYTGHTCGDGFSALCPSGCRNGGECIRGFCHCKPPYWGLDCSRQRAWELAPGATAIPNRHVLRIYVYDLPANVAFPVALDDNVVDLNEPSYQTHRKFMELLLMDPTVRTENPHEANLFYVPATAYSYSSNTNPPTNQIASALRYVAQHYPYFNVSGGRDHFIWTTGDRGSCYLNKNLSHVIHVTLFGLHASLRDNGTTFLKPLPALHPNFGCYHPKKDVLAAPWYDHMVGSTEAPELYARVLAAGAEAPERDLLFFFAGSVRPNDPSYSGGARQALSTHLKALLSGGEGNFSDIMFLEGYTHDYEKLYLRSKFCLAPHGAGFGVRLTLAMTHACVPVIVQDQVYQPYESDGVLPYHEFSLRLSMSDIPHIVPLLRAVSGERLRRMRLAMARYHKAFLWNPEIGGRAYNYTIRALRQRLHGLWGHLWGDPHDPAASVRRLRSSHHHRHHSRLRHHHHHRRQ